MVTEYVVALSLLSNGTGIRDSVSRVRDPIRDGECQNVDVCSTEA